MKGFFVLCLLYLCAVPSSHAQQIPNPEKIIYRVFYEHEHLRDTTKDDVYTENMVLFLAETSSLFSSYDKIRTRVERKEHVSRQISMGNVNIRFDPGSVTIPEDYIVWYGHNNIIVLGYLARLLAYEEEVPPIEWTIVQGDTKVIEGLKCYKASANYMGRTWNVWFTPEISYPAGPWLLRGLPGLILEAEDSLAQVSYRFTHLEGAAVEHEILDRAPDYEKVQLHSIKMVSWVSKEEFMDMKADAQKDVRNFQIRQITTMRNKGVIDFWDYGIFNPNSWSQRIPNPIALEE